MARKFYTEDGETIPAIQYVNSAPVGYTLIIDETQLIRLYSGVYVQRETDGKSYFNSFRSKLMLNIMDGIYTELEVFALESLIKVLAVEISSGNWLTAQNLNENLEVSGIYTQIMKDEIQLVINTYVTEHY